MYVAGALLILFVIHSGTNKKTGLALYVLGMIGVNICWQLAIRKMF